MRFIRSRFTSAHLIALLALFVALGGSAYAIHLGKNAVKTKNIKNGAVIESKLAPGAVSDAKLAPGAVSAAKLAAGSIRAANLGDIVVRTASVSLPDGVGNSATALCAPDERPLGSTARVLAQGQSDVATEGIYPSHPDHSVLLDGEPLKAGDGFTASFHNTSGGFTSTTFGNVSAFCLK